MKTLTPTVIGLAAALALSLLVLFFLNGFARMDLTAPYYYYSDGLQYLAISKSILTNGSAFTNNSLAFPFQFQLYDYPLPTLVYWTFFLAASLVTSNVFVAMNAWVLFCFMANTAAFVLFGRAMRLSVPLLAGLVVFFVVNEYFVARAAGHLTSIFLVGIPATAFLLYRIRHWSPGTPVSRRVLLWDAMTAVLIGLSMHVYAALALLSVAMYGVFRALMVRNWRVVLFPLALLVTITLSHLLLNYSAPLLHWATEGRQTEALRRSPMEQRLYGLQTGDLLLPVRTHIPLLKNVVQRHAQNRQNVEGRDAFFGYVPAFGFLLALMIAGVNVLSPRPLFEHDEQLDWELIAAWSFSCLAAYLFALPSGMGYMINLIAPGMRTYGRVSPFLAAFSLYLLILLLPRIRFPWPRRREIQIALLAVIAALLFLDNAAGLRIDRVQKKYLPRYERDRTIMQKLQQRYPQGGPRVLQLPSASYPGPYGPTESKLGIEPYENLSPYILADGFSWSAGKLVGSHAFRWEDALYRRSPPALVTAALNAGFDMVMVYKQGSDRSIVPLMAWLEKNAENIAQNERIAVFALDASLRRRYTLGERIEFGTGQNGEYYKSDGFTYAGETATWSEGPNAVIDLWLVEDSFRGDLSVKIVARNALAPQRPVVNGTVFANAIPVGEWRLTGPAAQVGIFVVPGGLVGDDGHLRIRMRVDNPVSPKALGINEDARKLGLYFVEMSLYHSQTK